MSKQVLALLDVEASVGLGDKEAWHRLLACGENELRAEKGPSYWHIFLEEVYEGPQVRVGGGVGVEMCGGQPVAYGGRRMGVRGQVMRGLVALWRWGWGWRMWDKGWDVCVCLRASEPCVRVADGRVCIPLLAAAVV